MRLPILTPQSSICIFLIIYAFLFSSSTSEPRISEAGRFCGHAKHNSSSNFIPNFITVMDFISNDVNAKRWGEYTIASPAPEVYAFAQCYDDLSPIDCAACFAVSRTKLPLCLPSTSARIYLDGCFLGYDDHEFSHQSLDEEHKNVKCSSSRIDVSKSKTEEFARKVEDVIGNVTEKAVSHGGFGVFEQRGGVKNMYALAQCWKTINESGCRECLEEAGASLLRECVPVVEGRAMFAGCYLRYSTERFYGIESDSEDCVKVEHIVATILSAMVLCLLVLFGAVMAYKRLSKRNEVYNGPIQISISIHKNNLNFKYEMLEKATNFFDASRKLGQGGAVKRLYFNTRQWVDDFFNEVNLISGIQHQNLVKLLGCSIEGPESLLVYEYVPNKSLDQVLFDKGTLHILNWQQRFDIICGIAEGLVYLHGSCGVKIIHRDIKASNILLDENLIPKIADFGLARCVGPDKSHLSTGIAGTLGYMAPEYLVRGQLTDKADVYAFGVMVLEIVSGRKNRVFAEGSSSILYAVWKHYKARNITEAVDPILKGGFPEREASDVLRIGLLCTQASLAVRPSMTEVVQMLTDKECVIPSPKQPPFLNASILSSDVSRTSMKYFLSQPIDGAGSPPRKSSTAMPCNN
ncbi:cysteine-rich receptor-like protein kinase 1 isoform X2 [Prunus yedoensis var. nudiflora]|uniref:Cysteine-rich receptor-like protein kinase 1 isoform X2 n=1 Tax=Prunus yedoensis var. nudiflora TaxID=2094558 RepID=A0A314Y245_PRUYE|nr:cysteine-rich receptor-like protein kinase 1 isoform X2 [Prunus yedoensis var. nudiflora]